MVVPTRWRRLAPLLPVLPLLFLSFARPTAQVQDAAALVDPFIGTSGAGNTFPGAVLPFGMLAWSPETSRGDASRPAAPGGYHYDAPLIRGFSLTHLSGTGCRGASGDIPFMPYTRDVDTSPSLDAKNEIFASAFAHKDEFASPGAYTVTLASGVKVELSATARTGAARFTFPDGAPSIMLVRTSDTQVGSGDARIQIDPATRTITGSVTSGNFCGYIHPVSRRDYYTVYFVATFDRPFAATGTWTDGTISRGGLTAGGGTSYGSDGFPPPGKGSGGWVQFEPDHPRPVSVRVGISYVSLDNARSNLQSEQPPRVTFEDVRKRAREAWNRALGRIVVEGGSERERRIFTTALYHSLLHMNLSSDANGEYRGFDGRVHKIASPQRAQYANFSGWDIYRAQVQLVALLDPVVASDMAQSLLNQAAQNNGVWDRWTHNTGATHVMEGDPAAPAIASMAAFGATTFDLNAALSSLKRAATTPTPLDLSADGCRVMCPGQRPSLDKWLTLNYIPAVSNAWGGAGATLESAIADFAVSQLARRAGDARAEQQFRERSDYWRNVFNPTPVIAPPRGRGGAPTNDGEAPQAGGYIQDRNEDGSWPPLTPSASSGFAEGSSVQYTWMVPFNTRGLIAAMGGADAANKRLDAFFRRPDGAWALRNAGGLHAQMSNEPSIAVPWVYLFSGRPDRAQETVREALDTLWNDTPDGIPGNDDLGTMSAWYVWSAMGLYPYYPGRAELLITTPLFSRVTIHRASGVRIVVEAPGAGESKYISSLLVNGRSSARAWLPETFISNGGRLSFVLSKEPDQRWGRAPADLPPSFPPK